LELQDLPLDQMFQKKLNLSSVLFKTKYDDLSEKDKKDDIIIIKEAFTFLDKKRKSIGVFTRSTKDHSSLVGDCSTLLCGNFDKSQCTIRKDGKIIYNAKNRLHNYVSKISGLFNEVVTKEIPTIYYHNKVTNKKYLYLVFELTCSSDEMPLCYHLDNRKEDLFIGLRNLNDVSRGLKCYNESTFNVDMSIVDSLSSSIRFPYLKKFSIIDKIIDAKLSSFTLFKVNLTGL
jgi:hypothetical protein